MSITMGQTGQRMNALERANQIRCGRAEMSHRIKRGELAAQEVLLDTPEVAATMTVSALLIAQPRWGTTRTRKALSRLQISERKEIQTLTERQRRILAEAISPRNGPGVET